MYFGRKAEPKGSKLTWARDKERSMDRHQQRLKNMKSSIDNSAPRKFKHLKRNLKKEQMLEDRYAAIEHENRILLNKMSEIMRKSTMEENKSEYRFGHSTNRTRRKAELQRITEENQKILHRIQRATPVYNHWEWEEEREKQEELIEQMCEFKPPLLKKSRRRGLAASGQASLGQHPGNQYMQEPGMQGHSMQGGGISGYYLDAPPTGSAQGSYTVQAGMGSGSIGYATDGGSQFGGHFLGTAGSMGSYGSAQFGPGSEAGSMAVGAPGSAAMAGFGAAAGGHGGS